jgi:DNA invertase Pin-like site-specific DNA recombinase
VSNASVAVLYCRVSTEEQAVHGASLGAQEQALRAEAERRGMEPFVIREEGLSAKNMKRPGLQSALTLLDKKKAATLLAVRLDRVSRSVHDFSGLMKRAEAKGWTVTFLDNGIDTSTTSGKFTAHVMVAAAELERNLIADRTREAMAQRKREGAVFGRVVEEVTLPAYERALALHADGLTPTQIAYRFNADAVPTARGGAQWYRATVVRLLQSETAKRLQQATR